jgi:hypothetical protein
MITLIQKTPRLINFTCDGSYFFSGQIIKLFCGEKNWMVFVNGSSIHEKSIEDAIFRNVGRKTEWDDLVAWANFYGGMS